MGDIFYQGEMEERFGQMQDRCNFLIETLKEIKDSAEAIEELPLCPEDTPEDSLQLAKQMDDFISEVIQRCEEALE